MNIDDNQLQRAHQLSAQGATLSRPADADAPTLRQARDAYSQAADLFEAASATADTATRQTLRMLLLQHRNLARDLDRRIAGLTSAPSAPPSPVSPSSPSTSTSPFSVAGPSRPRSGTRAHNTTPPLVGRRASGAAVGLGAGSGGMVNRPGLVHATSVPPFSLRPVDSVPPPPPPPHAPFGNPSSPRELYSSSSSSEPPDESFLLPGPGADTHDPFSRFWGMLENMLDDISMPRALASAPLDILAAMPSAARRESMRKPKGKSRAERTERADRSPSPSESFYLVPRGRERPDPDDASAPMRNASPSNKTKEELVLENESLRASLDALAKHTHQVEMARRVLAERAEERDKLVRSVVVGVQREAQKVRHDQEVIRSQMLASTAGLPPGQSPLAPPIAALRKRVGELEGKVGQLEGEIEQLKDDKSKLRALVDRYKEKWDKLKAKKEAKVALAKVARASGSPDAA